MNDKFIDSILTDVEKEKLIQFSSDKVMFQAVEKVVLAGLYTNGTLRQGKDANPLTNAAFSLASAREYSDEQLGQDLRGMWEGINALEGAYKKIAEFAVAPTGIPAKKTPNKAR